MLRSVWPGFRMGRIVCAVCETYWRSGSPSSTPPSSTPRGELLDGAKGLIEGDRNNQYGPPTQDFQRSADALNALGYRRPGGDPLRSFDIAILVSMIKFSRLMWSPEKRDHWEDIAGYAGCGWECVVDDGEKPVQQ